MFARTLLVTAAAIALAHQVTAQTRRGVEVAPAVGAYLPTGDLRADGAVPAVCYVDARDPAETCLPYAVRAHPAVAVGGRVTDWLSNQGAIEGSFWYTRSGVSAGFFPVDTTFKRAGTFVMAALRFVLSLAPHAPTMSALILGGPAIAYHDGPISLGGALGFALDMRPKRLLGVRAQVEDYLYGEDSQDFVLSLSMTFGQRGVVARGRFEPPCAGGMRPI